MSQMSGFLSKAKEEEEKKENEEGKGQASYTKLKDLPKATKLVFSRLPFVFITLGVCVESFNISIGGAFMPKIIQTQFYLPPGKAALLFGVIAIPCAFSGNLLGRLEKFCQQHAGSLISYFEVLTSKNETVLRKLSMGGQHL